MLSVNPTRPLAILTVIAGLLAVAGPAAASSTDLHSRSTAVVTDNKDPDGQYARIQQSADGIIAVLIGV
jgi:hypothetical protein